jgi:hypothetical protein
MGRIEKLSSLVIAIVLVTATILASANMVSITKAVLPQNDAGSGTDAGNTWDTSIRVYSNVSYTGTLDPPPSSIDTDDFYNFTAYKGHWINVTMTPPSDANYDLRLYDPSKVGRDASTNGTGMTEEIRFNCSDDGIWFIHVYHINGVGGNYHFFIQPINYPPETPAAPTGPATGYVYTPYAFSAMTTDQENDNINYTFDWGDTTPQTTVGPYPNGTTVYATHQWIKPIAYDITIRAQDVHLNWSGWSAKTSIMLGQNDDARGTDAANNTVTAHYIGN